jgi:hypothetical protein
MLVIKLNEDLYLPLNYLDHRDNSRFEWRASGDVAILPEEYIEKLKQADKKFEVLELKSFNGNKKK